MRYVILIHEKSFDYKEINNIFEENWKIKSGKDFAYIQEADDNNYVQIDRCSEIREDYEKEDIAVFNRTLESPDYSYVKYHDLILLRKVLHIITANLACYIDNDHGIFLEGHQFVQKWLQLPSWTWE